MSIQYTVPGFEPMTYGMWVSSHNHKTRAPAHDLVVTYDVFVFGIGVGSIFILLYRVTCILDQACRLQFNNTDPLNPNSLSHFEW